MTRPDQTPHPMAEQEWKDMAPRCATCRHFERAEGFRLGSCGRWHIGYGINWDTTVGDNEVVVENDEGWGMAMGPDFGCVLHDPLPPAPNGE